MKKVTHEEAERALSTWCDFDGGLCTSMGAALEEFVANREKEEASEPAAPTITISHGAMTGCTQDAIDQAMREAVQDTDEFITLAEHKAKMRAAIEFISRHWVSGDVEACKDECMRKFGFTEPTPADRVTVTKNSEPSGEYYPYGVALDGCVDAIFITEKNAERYALGLISQLEKESQ